MTVAMTEKELRPINGATAPKGAATAVDVEAAAKKAMEVFVASLTRHTDEYVASVNEYIAKAKGNGTEAKLVDPITFPFGLPPYPWWNLVMAGPFQVLGPGTAGPFAPHKIIKAGEPAFMLGAIWRNPAPINWAPPGPGPIQLMAALEMSVQFQTLNLTTNTRGPVFTPIGVPLPLGYANPIPFYTPLNFATPNEGVPELYEINLVADQSGPVHGLPFAGYATWHFDPDIEPPFLHLPAIAPSLEHDIPARILVYV